MHTWGPLAIAIAISSYSCTGLGLLMAAVALSGARRRGTRECGFGLLMIFAGVNVPLTSLPGWAAAVAQRLPLTHGIAAARELASGSGINAIGGQLGWRQGLVVMYTILVLVTLLLLEAESKRKSTLDVH